MLHHSRTKKRKRIENTCCVPLGVCYSENMTTNNTSTQAELIAAAAQQAAAAKHAALVNKVQGWTFIAVVLAFCVLSFLVVR